MVISSFLKINMSIPVLIWSTSTMKIAQYVHAISVKWPIYHVCTAKDVPSTHLIHKATGTRRPRLVTLTPETVFALNFDIQEQDGFLLLG